MHILNPRNIEADTLALCEIGNRFVGTPGEAEAREFIARRFRESGLVNVHDEPFEVATYRHIEARCQMQDAAGKSDLSCVGLQFTDIGEVEAEGVYIGTLEALSDLEAAISAAGGIAGRIALFRSPYPYMFAEALVDARAVAIVAISTARDGYVSHLNALMYPALAASPNGTRLPIPGVVVEQMEAARLIEHLSGSSPHVRVVHDCRYELVQTANVVGEIVGAEANDERAVIGAHYDTQLEGVGGSDNASGVASLIEIAGVSARHPHRRRLVFVAFANEEGGFRGSAEYCRRNADRLADTVGMINVDAPGWAPAAPALHADPAMLDFALETAEREDWHPAEIIDASEFPGSDHNPFIDAGVPAAFFWRHPPTHPYYHTAGDKPDLLDFGIVAETASVACAAFHRLGNDSDLALGRSRPVRRWLDLRPDNAN